MTLFCRLRRRRSKSLDAVDLGLWVAIQKDMLYNNMVYQCLLYFFVQKSIGIHTYDYIFRFRKGNE